MPPAAMPRPQAPVTAPVPMQMKIAKWVGYFAFIDLLLLPYFQGIIMPYSLPVVIIALLAFGVRIAEDVHYKLFLVIAAAVLLSLCTSMFLAESAPYRLVNLKWALQFLSSFTYFFYFRWLAARTPLRIWPINVVFVVWFLFLSYRFVDDPGGTVELIRTLYGRLVMEEQEANVFRRFAYIFSDPNTAAYFLLIAAAPLIAGCTRALLLVALIVGIGFAVVASQSRGAAVAMVIVMLATLFPPKSALKISQGGRRLFLLLMLAGALYAGIRYVADLAQSDLSFELAYTRLFEDTESYSRGGDRFTIWTHYFTTILPLPVGRGFMFDVDGSLFYPHSDFLRLAYSYGLFALPPCIWFFFSRIFSYPQLVVPAAVAFGINALIDEQKLFGLFLATLAIQLATRQPAPGPGSRRDFLRMPVRHRPGRGAAAP